MTVPPVGIFEPFPDITVDRRDAAQQDADVAHTKRQVGFYGNALQQSGATLAKLETRRAGATDVVQFELASTIGGGQALVVPGELLVRLSAAPGLVSAEDHLTAQGFVRQTHAVPGVDIPGIDSRIARFVGPAGVDVVPHIKSLLYNGYAAGHTCVTAFQSDADAADPANAPAPPPPPPGGNVVVKMEEGPSPTEVTQPDLYLPDTPREPVGAVVVAVIDTGIALKERTDQWLQGIDRSADRIDPLDAFPDNPPKLPGNGRLDFAAGHGTFAAAIVQSVEAQAKIVAYRALDSDGYGSELDVAAAMIAAVQEGAQVISMSLGVRTVDGKCPLAIQAALDAIAEMTKGSPTPPVIVAAAGNFGDTTQVFPAAADGVLAVGALTAEGAPAPWSSHGDWVRFSTIGEGIVAPYVEGKQDKAFGSEDDFPANSWAVWTGTSFAAPQIAAAIARTCREKSLSPTDAAKSLVDDGTKGAAYSGYGSAMILLPGTPTDATVVPGS